MSDKNIDVQKTLNLAVQNHKKGNLDLAEELYIKTLKINPDHERSIYLLSTLYLHKKNYKETIKLSNRALEINPKNIHIIHNLGYGLIQLGKHEEAKKLFYKIIEIKPTYVEAYYNLGNIYKYFGNSLEAEKYYRKAIKIEPNSPKAHNNFGNILKDLGKINDAIKSYERSIKLNPKYVYAYYNLGNAYKESGQLAKAKVSYENALKINPSNLEILFIKLELSKEKINIVMKKKIEQAVNNLNLSTRDLAFGNFILSRYERQKSDYKKEFNYLIVAQSYLYKWGSKIKYDEGVNYWIKRIPINKELGILGKTKKRNEIKPIFIVGVPRCGSTLIEKIIASGKINVPIGEETQVISLAAEKIIQEDKSFSSEIENLKEEIMKKYKEKGLLKDKNIFTDKSLDNFFFIGLIKRIFPNSKIINCKRNPVASIMSILQNNLAEISWAHNIEHIFKYFDIYFDKINYFKNLYPNMIYELELEKFISSPELESKRLMKYCELPWDKKCLEFYKRKDFISKTASNVQIRKAIYQDPPDKYQVYKEYLNKYGKKYLWFK